MKCTQPTTKPTKFKYIASALLYEAVVFFFASYDADDFVANTKLWNIIRLNTILFFVFFSCCVS